MLQIHSIVLLDCGGAVDIGEFFQLSEQMSVYVVDSHRPFHLNNLYKNDQVFILDDGDIDEQMAPVREAFDLAERAIERGSDDEDDDEDEEEGEEDEEDEDEDDEDEDDDEASSEKEEDDDDTAEGEKKSRKRKKPLQHKSAVASAMAKRARLAQAEALLNNYYSGNWFGASVAGMLFGMASQLAKESREQLWYAVPVFSHCC